ncbi:hypothetical protein D3C79_966290 [compost metagenome]
MHWAVGRLAQQLQVGVVDGVGEVQHVRQDRRERRTLQHGRHAVACVLEDAAHHLEGDRVDVVVDVMTDDLLAHSGLLIFIFRCR